MFEGKVSSTAVFRHPVLRSEMVKSFHPIYTQIISKAPFKMLPPPFPDHEVARLAALYQYNVLDTAAEPAFDEITELAACICRAPIALISLIDETRQWFKSRLGLEVPESDRAIAFCAYTILQSDLLIVPDTMQDRRFGGNPWVTGGPKIRFYAAAPLITPQGYAIGSLCVLDHHPRELNQEQTQALRVLARQVITQLELRRHVTELTQTVRQLGQTEQALQQAHSRLEVQVQERTAELARANQQLQVEIAERKQTEALLQQRQEEFIALVENAPDVIMRIDREFRYRYINSKVEEGTGLPVSAFVGRTVREVALELDVPESIISLWYTSTRQVFERGQEYPIEYTIVTPGGPVDYSSRLVPEFGPEGGVETVLAIVRDITNLKQAEAALRQQAERERLIVNITQRIRQSLDLDTIFSTAVLEIGTLLQMDYVDIAQYLPEQKVWLHVACYARNPEITPSSVGLSIPDENNPITERLKRLEIVELQDNTFQEQVHPTLAQTFIGARLLVPLQAGSTATDQQATVWGRLRLGKHQPPFAWQDAEIELACTVANQLAIAIQQAELHQQGQQLNAHLEQQVQDRTAQLQQALVFESLLKRIMDKVRDSLDERQILQTAVQELALGLNTLSCDTGLYNLAQGNSTVCYEFLRAHCGIPSALGHVLSLSDGPEIYRHLLQGQYLQFCWLPALSTSIRRIEQAFTILACPIVDDQGAIGDLWLYRSGEQCFEEIEIRLIQQVANQCAIALRQARLYQAAQAQVEELERLNRLKDDFLSTISHELRTPMANIKLATKMLELFLKPLGILDAESGQAIRYFRVLHDECEREINLINDLLDLSRLDAKIEPSRLTTIDPSRWIVNLVEPFLKRARDQQQQLQLDLAPTLPALTTDLSGLGRILTELLNNACKYTPAGEKILVKVEGNVEILQLSVTNTGVEIPASELPHIFDRFYRISHPDRWRYGGTGLGLALVKQLVGQLQGTIWVESVNQQTIFRVQLPRRLDTPRSSPLSTQVLEEA